MDSIGMFEMNDEGSDASSSKYLFSYFQSTGSRGLLLFSDGLTSWEPVETKPLDLSLESEKGSVEEDHEAPEKHLFVIDDDLRIRSDESPPGLHPPDGDLELLKSRTD
jgi:hypothetical protein